MKQCARCKEDKPLSDFYRTKRSKDGHHPYCKLCQNAINERWRLNNLERRAEMQRHAQRRRLFGLDRDEYAGLLVQQGGGCAICGATEAGGRWNTFAVDHDHDTGAVRGLLCNNCNLGIGYLGDNIGRLEAAISYLKGARRCTTTI